MKRLRGLPLACLLLATAAGAADVRVRAVDAVGMTVSDMDRSVDFYSRILGFTPVKRANDLVHWQTRLVADHDALEKLGQAHPVAVPGHELGFARGVTVRDPDGHALEMVEP